VDYPALTLGQLGRFAFRLCEKPSRLEEFMHGSLLIVAHHIKDPAILAVDPIDEPFDKGKHLTLSDDVPNSVESCPGDSGWN
jgi:hypothetical protein